MSTETAHGIILRIWPLGDTSVVVHWLTAEFGRMATVAKGARGQKSTFTGKLDLCYAAEFSFRRSRRGDLHALAEVVVTNNHAAMRRDLDSLEILAHAVSCILGNERPDAKSHLRLGPEVSIRPRSRTRSFFKIAVARSPSVDGQTPLARLERSHPAERRRGGRATGSPVGA
jgi:hypothetical protein